MLAHHVDPKGGRVREWEGFELEIELELLNLMIESCEACRQNNLGNGG